MNEKKPYGESRKEGVSLKRALTDSSSSTPSRKRRRVAFHQDPSTGREVRTIIPPSLGSEEDDDVPQVTWDKRATFQSALKAMRDCFAYQVEEHQRKQAAAAGATDSNSATTKTDDENDKELSHVEVLAQSYVACCVDTDHDDQDDALPSSLLEAGHVLLLGTTSTPIKTSPVGQTSTSTEIVSESSSSSDSSLSSISSSGRSSASSTNKVQEQDSKDEPTFCYRGLEVQTLPGMGRDRAMRRKAHIRTVTQLYGQLFGTPVTSKSDKKNKPQDNASTTSSETPEEAPADTVPVDSTHKPVVDVDAARELIKKTSMEMTQSSRKFARTLGAADAIAAMMEHAEQDEETKTTSQDKPLSSVSSLSSVASIPERKEPIVTVPQAPDYAAYASSNGIMPTTTFDNRLASASLMSPPSMSHPVDVSYPSQEQLWHLHLLQLQQAHSVQRFLLQQPQQCMSATQANSPQTLFTMTAHTVASSGLPSTPLPQTPQQSRRSRKHLADPVVLLSRSA